MKLYHLFENEVPKITDPYEAYKYALTQDKRIPELEPIIMKHPQIAQWYATDVIKDRWPEAEPDILKNDFYANAYLRAFPEVRTPSKDVPLVLGNYAVMDVPNTITDEQVEKLIKIIEPKLLPNATRFVTHNWRLYDESTIKRKLENNKLKHVTTKHLINNEELKTEFLKNIDCNFNPEDFE